jgi:hypothetical protein
MLIILEKQIITCGRRDDIQIKMLIHDVRNCLADVTLIRNQTSATKRTRQQDFLKPLAPFWIIDSIGFFVRRLEHTQYLLKEDGKF